MLENFHLAEAFRMLREPDSDVFDTPSLSAGMRRDVRESIIVMVLATDMQLHLNVMSEIQVAMTKANESKCKRMENRIKLN